MRNSAVQHHADDAPLSNEEIEAILAQENALPPESHTPAPTHDLAQTSGRDMAWGKWLLVLLLVAEFLMFYARK